MAAQPISFAAFASTLPLRPVLDFMDGFRGGPTSQPQAPMHRRTNSYDMEYSVALHGHQHQSGSGSGSIVALQNHSQSRSVAQTGAMLHLTGTCENCYEPVSIPVPQWMSSAMERAAVQRGGTSQREEELLLQLESQRRQSDELRRTVVETVVWLAESFKRSRIPGWIWDATKAFLAVLLWLDEQFRLKEQLAACLQAFFEGLVEIEKEAGLFRKVGEILSVLWEATIKGTIALASSDASLDSHTASNVPSFSRPHSHYNSTTSTPATTATTTTNYDESPPLLPTVLSSPPADIPPLGDPSLTAPHLRRLRSSHSSPSLPGLSRQGSGGLHPHSVPLSRVSSGGSNGSSTSSLSPPDYAMATGAGHAGSKVTRRRSRSATGGDRVRPSTDEDDRRNGHPQGWAGRIGGVVGRTLRG